MAPNPELLPVFDIDSIVPPYVPPLPEEPLLEADESPSDDSSSSPSNSSEDLFAEQYASIYEPIEIPIEQNLRELLVCAAQTKRKFVTLF